MKRVALLLLVGCLGTAAQGQPAPWKQRAKQLTVLPDLVSNDVRELTAAGDSLWSGPLLTLYLEPNDRRQPGDSLLLADRPEFTESEDVAFSIAARNDTVGQRVWAGLAFDTGGGEPGVRGFLVSNDGGDTFTARGPQLDQVSDTTIEYGGSTLSAVPIRQQASSTPQDLAFGRGDTVWVAGQRSGLRWTADGGQQWHRAVLPPDTRRSVDPRTPTDFLVAPRLDDGRGWLNHIAYSVLVDETGTVWAGTVNGVNRSRPADQVPGGRRAWTRFAGTDLTGTFVAALAEQPRPGKRNLVWMATWPGQQGGVDQGAQRFGLTVTSDGGDTFRQTLIGERIFEVAARQARVYAVGPTGLFVSRDQGRTWRSVEQFPLKNPDQALPGDVTTRSVTVTTRALWVGTSDGLLRLDRTEEVDLLTRNPEWTLLRAQTPVNPEEPSDTVPDVSTYAYPNPFVPARDQLVRIAYELDRATTVEVNIYDFGMNQVRTITEQKSAGQQETIWRGTDDQGLRVPTGTYFYTVEAGGRTFEGKILVAN